MTPDTQGYLTHRQILVVMGGLMVGLLTGRREIVAALAGATIGVVTSLAVSPTIGIIAGGVVGPFLGLLAPPSPSEGERS